MDSLVMKYFVLNPNKKDTFGKASRMAMLKYAEIIADKAPDFAESIKNWVLSIQVKHAGFKR